MTVHKEWRVTVQKEWRGTVQKEWRVTVQKEWREAIQKGCTKPTVLNHHCIPLQLITPRAHAQQGLSNWFGCYYNILYLYVITMVFKQTLFASTVSKIQLYQLLKVGDLL